MSNEPPKKTKYFSYLFHFIACFCAYLPPPFNNIGLLGPVQTRLCLSSSDFVMFNTQPFWDNLRALERSGWRCLPGLCCRHSSRSRYIGPPCRYRHRSSRDLPSSVLVCKICSVSFCPLYSSLIMLWIILTLLLSCPTYVSQKNGGVLNADNSILLAGEWEAAAVGLVFGLLWGVGISDRLHLGRSKLKVRGPSPFAITSDANDSALLDMARADEAVYKFFVSLSSFVVFGFFFFFLFIAMHKKRAIRFERTNREGK